MSSGLRDAPFRRRWPCGKHRGVGAPRSECGYSCGHSEGGRTMRSVGVREFRDQATSMMSSGETLVIERHGEPIGFFVPVNAKDRRAGREVLGQLGAVLEAVRAESGMTEDELVDEL